MWWTNHNVEFAIELYARAKTVGSMSSIRTAIPSVGWPAWSSRPPGACRAARRSVSDRAAHTHAADPARAAADSPDTSPPPPRRAITEPFSRANESGPRFDATRMSTPPRVIGARWSGGGKRRGRVGASRRRPPGSDEARDRRPLPRPHVVHVDRPPLAVRGAAELHEPRDRLDQPHDAVLAFQAVHRR